MSDFDSPWKEALDCYFEAFLALFFPHINDQIDWAHGYESLDNELQQIMPDAETGRRYVDKLVKVWRKDGIEQWVLIHIEIQHGPEDEFPRRMFAYHYRLRDRYDRKVASLAVLGDDRADWRPTRYDDELWGCRVEFTFPMVKLIDWTSSVAELERDANPFAVVVLADLKARETRKDPLSRKEWKFRILRGLYERGVGSDEIRRLFRFIDWMMDLPEPLAIEFNREYFEYEKEKTMPYVTSVERHGIEKGKIEGKIEGWLESVEFQIEQRFGTTGTALLPRIREIHDIEKLKSLSKAITKASSIEEVLPLLLP